MAVRIRAAADALGVEPHVLRHWEDVGVVRPPRAGNGYRDYNHETMIRLRIILGCRAAGLSLDQTRVVMHRDAEERDESSDPGGTESTNRSRSSDAPGGSSST